MNKKILIPFTVLLLLLSLVSASVSHNTPNTDEKIITFEHDGTTINVEFMTTNPAGIVLPLVADVGLETAFERVNENRVKYTYELNLPNQEFKAVNRITSTEAITKISDYKLKVKNTYISYQDAVDLGITVNITVVDENTVNIIMYKDYQGNSKFIIDPEIYGLNFNVKTYQVTKCTPNWQPYAYSECFINDSKLVLSYQDLNECGLVYDGDYEYDSCDYCTPSWFCSEYEDVSGCENQVLECSVIGDYNDCFSQTGLEADNFTGNSSDYDYVGGCYLPAYMSRDLPLMVFDGIGSGGLMIISLMGIIAPMVVYLLWLKSKKG